MDDGTKVLEQLSRLPYICVTNYRYIYKFLTSSKTCMNFDIRKGVELVMYS